MSETKREYSAIYNGGTVCVKWSEFHGAWLAFRDGKGVEWRRHGKRGKCFRTFLEALAAVKASRIGMTYKGRMMK